MADLKFTPDRITVLEPHQVFVFGSNLSGMHIGGAAKIALQWGAINGQYFGLSGQTYAIPTVGHSARGTLSLEDIKPFVGKFIIDVLNHPDKEFLVTEIGCGIAGLKTQDVGPLFRKAIGFGIIILPKRFIEAINAS